MAAGEYPLGVLVLPLLSEDEKQKRPDFLLSAL
jgi:hypothetical protein